jgi:hypothetical protein
MVLERRTVKRDAGRSSSLVGNPSTGRMTASDRSVKWDSERNRLSVEKDAPRTLRGPWRDRSRHSRAKTRRWSVVLSGWMTASGQKWDSAACRNDERCAASGVRTESVVDRATSAACPPLLVECETRRALRGQRGSVVDSASVAAAGTVARMAATWLILPVVICLSQRLSHACLSTNLYTVKLRMAH